MPAPPQIKKIAILSNYTPIQCGISTFAKNLFDSISSQKQAGETVVIGVDDGQPRNDFPKEVVFEVSKHSQSDYRLAAEYINSSHIDAVCIQHEYGIFGGRDGDLILDTINRITKPIIITLHTVLESPNPMQRRIMMSMASRASKLVVMSERAVEMLGTVYGISSDKITMIHHGVPDAFNLNRDFDEGQTSGAQLLTFGLLAPDKGIENVIQAMPKILEVRPDAKYLIVGATHPQVKKNHGETYRESLQKMAEDLGVANQVEFVNRFVKPCEIVKFLEEADIYVTPYLKREQITSGTLAYAVGSGKAVISTPYWYAEELLGEGRGILVPQRDPVAIADAAIEFLTNEEKRLTIKAKALELGKTMSWRSVGQDFIKLFESLGPAPRIEKYPLTEPVRMLPELNLNHLRRLTDDTGIIQHAIYTMPRYAEGYSLDDNCRALLLTSMIDGTSNYGANDLSDLSSRYLAFIAYAFNPFTQRYRNFLSYSGAWLENEGSEDSQGRTLWCLAEFASRAKNQSQVDCAIELYRWGQAAASSWTSVRAWAYAILGLTSLRGTPYFESHMESQIEDLAERIHTLHKHHSHSEWPWFEQTATYCNARIPQALIAAGQLLGNEQYQEVGLQTLEWIWQNQVDSEGFFEPLGCFGPYAHQGDKPRFDQQPVEVCATISACIHAWKATNNLVWKERAFQAFDWFLGVNHLSQRVYDPNSGGCFDGVQETSLNQNQGAESTISFLMACEEVKSMSTIRPIERERVQVI